jgi:hypothetical protein
MVVPEVLCLQTNKMRVLFTPRVRERCTSSNFCFILAFCFDSMPRRTRFAPLFRSAFRTRDSPFPIFVFSASSNTRPSNALLRWAPVRFSSSGFATPDRSCVWISLCRSASFCRFDLRLYQYLWSGKNESGVASHTSLSRRPHRILFSLLYS